MPPPLDKTKYSYAVLQFSETIRYRLLLLWQTACFQEEDALEGVSKRAVLRGTVAGFLVFTFGWLAMFIFWVSYGMPAVNGFTAFISGFFGDLFFLPAIAGGLVTYVNLSSSKISSRQRAFVVVLTFVSTIIGIAMQASWLISDTTRLNWTIPNLHQFNAAGWWHALFFVFMFSFVGNFSARFLIAIFQNSRQFSLLQPTASTYKPVEISIREQFAMFFVWFGFSGYLYLRVCETCSIGFADWKLLLCIPILALLSFGVIAITRFSCPKRILHVLIDDLRIALCAAAASYGLAAVSAEALGGTSFLRMGVFMVVFALLATILCPENMENPKIWLSNELMVAFLAFGCAAICLLSAQSLLPIILTPFLCALLIFVSSAKEESSSTKYDVWRVILKVLVIVVIIDFGIIVISPNSVLGSFIILFSRDSPITLLVAIVAGIGHYMWNMFKKYATMAEQEQPSDEVGRIKYLAYHRILRVFIALVILCFFMVGGDAVILGTVSFGGLTWIAILVAVALVLYFASTPNRGAEFRIVDMSFSSATKLFLLACCYFFLGMGLYSLREPMLISAWDLLLICPIVGSITFLINGIISNARLLVGVSWQNVKKDYTFIIALAIIAVGCLITYPLAVLPSRSLAEPSLTLLSPLLGLGALLVATLVLPWLSLRITGAPHEGKIIKDAGAGGGVRQDAQNAFILVTAAGLLAIHVIEWLRLLSGQIFTPLNFIVALAVSASFLVYFTFTNNSTHHESSVNETLTNSNGEPIEFAQPFFDCERNGEDISTLRTYFRQHLVRQSFITLLTLFPYCVVFSIHLVGKYFLSRYNSFSLFLFDEYLIWTPQLKTHINNSKHLTIIRKNLS
jgi:hypothetical protein